MRRLVVVVRVVVAPAPAPEDEVLLDEDRREDREPVLVGGA